MAPEYDGRPRTAFPAQVPQVSISIRIRCGKPFGTRSTIERIAKKLEGRHWMFRGSASRLDVLKMCEDCRVAAMSEQAFDPYAAPRPPVRTSEDYFREREKKQES